MVIHKQGKPEGFDSCDRPSNLAQTGFISLIFRPVWPWNSMDEFEKQQGTSSILFQASSIISKPSVNSNWSYSPESSIRVKINNFLFRVTLIIDGWPLKTIGHLCDATSSFVQVRVTTLIFLEEIGVTLKFNGWHRKMIGRVFFHTSSFAPHFPTISVFKPEVQSRNTQFGSKSGIFGPMWHWNLMNDHEKK